MRTAYQAVLTVVDKPVGTMDAVQWSASGLQRGLPLWHEIFYEARSDP